MPVPSDAIKAHELMRSGRLQEALPLAQRVASAARTTDPAHGFLAALLLKLGRPQEAEEVLTHALTLPTGIADAYDGLAYVSAAMRQHERANSLYRRATELAPRETRFWYNLASSERSLGRLEAAEAACDEAIRVDPLQYPTFLLRSELRVQSIECNHVAQLKERLEASRGEHRAQVFLRYALGKELDDLGRFDEAFGHFAAAAAARRARLAYEVAGDERKLQRIAAVFSRAWLGQQAGHPTEGSSRPVFIVGLPRSGTTLVERILTGLPETRSNGETENFSRALLAHARGGRDVFEQAASADFLKVGLEYERLSNPEGQGGFLIEKLPMNYLYLGAIASALPHATIVVVKRSSLDSCFAMFRTLFGEAYPFSYHLEELGRYYCAYQRLMDHWHSLIGDRLHEVVYEDLVRNPRAVGSAIAKTAGMIWDDAAIEIQNNRSVSLTASASQVRRPIYGTSSGRWRHYQAHLGPLISALHRP